MKIVVIGDPHGSLDTSKIPLDTDYILIPGDIGKADLARKYFFQYTVKGIDRMEAVGRKKVKESYKETTESIRYVLSSIDKLNIPTFWVYGNVENGIDKDIDKNKLNLEKIEKMKFKNINCVNYKISKIGEMSIFGIPFIRESGWVKNFNPKDKEQLKRSEKYEKTAKKYIKKADIVLSHNPPYGILDTVSNPNAPANWKGKHAGSYILEDYVKKHNPKLVICGHMHENPGVKKIGKTTVLNAGADGSIYTINMKNNKIEIKEV